ncbi:MAG TPA: flagellar biosynthetic protein FliO [Candidatus Hydrogenedentes bacterium]|jgi:flagellar biogenesis protein FliO|nr:flagellar biosynthetic protein FliO [Candidatus Hydrogenedentota bacterium]HPJ98119.1 flagellar biosynthetic protein FliO [Candidatus Hydrogenedentota bacterium]
MKTQQASSGARLILAAALVLGCVWGVCAQDPASEPVETLVQPEDNNEYEATLPPQLDLRSDLTPTVPPEPVPEIPAVVEPAEPPVEPSAESPDPFMEQVNRELAARRGTAPDSAGANEPAAFPVTERRPRSLLRAFAWLLVVIALILLVYYVLQRRGRGGPLRLGSQLGTVLGRIYLSPRMCLHFVRTGGKVLVVGQTQNALTLIADFNEAEFAVPVESAAQGAAGEAPAEPKADFLSLLRDGISRIYRTGVEHDQASEPVEPVGEDDIAALRGDIHRLQEYLRDSMREPEA